MFVALGLNARARALIARQDTARLYEWREIQKRNMEMITDEILERAGDTPTETPAFSEEGDIILQAEGNFPKVIYLAHIPTRTLGDLIYEALPSERISDYEVRLTGQYRISVTRLLQRGRAPLTHEGGEDDGD